jgi:hypothetical protein
MQLLGLIVAILAGGLYILDYFGIKPPRSGILSSGEARVKNWRFLVVSALLILNLLFAGVNWYERTQDIYRFDPQVKLETIRGRLFQNEVVDMDAKDFSDCTFRNVTLRYNGVAPTKLSFNHFQGNMQLTSDNPVVMITWALDKGLGMNSDMPMLDKNGHPIEGVRPPTKQQ